MSTYLYILIYYFNGCLLVDFSLKCEESWMEPPVRSSAWTEGKARLTPQRRRWIGENVGVLACEKATAGEGRVRVTLEKYKRLNSAQHGGLVPSPARPCCCRHSPCSSSLLFSLDLWKVRWSLSAVYVIC